MNIFHFGCSFSAFDINENGKTVSHLLNNLLIDKKYDINYYLLAVGGGSIDLQYELLKNIFLNTQYKLDCVIFQVTHPNRGYTKLKQPYFDKSTEQFDKGILTFNRQIRESYNWHNVDNVFPKEFWNKSYQKYVKSKIKYENNLFDNWMGTILLIKAFCEKNDIPLIMYSHMYSLGVKNILSESEHFIEEYFDFDVSKVLPDFTKYVVDKGNHFAEEGNKRVAEILLPLVQKKLDL